MKHGPFRAPRLSSLTLQIAFIYQVSSAKEFEGFPASIFPVSSCSPKIRSKYRSLSPTMYRRSTIRLSPAPHPCGPCRSSLPLFREGRLTRDIKTVVSAQEKTQRQQRTQSSFTALYTEFMFSKLQVFASLLAATVASAATIGGPIPTTSLPKFKLSASVRIHC
jgi:hypothetical protein